MSAQAVLFDIPGPKARRRQTIAAAIGVLLLVGMLGLVGYQLRAQLTWEMFRPFSEGETWTAYVIPGIVGTLKAAAISVAAAVVLGFLLGMGRLSHVGALRWMVSAFVEFFRSVPVLVMMLAGYYIFMYNGLFEGDALALMGVVTGLTIYNSCVIAELLRAGVHSLPGGQREAALAIGLSRRQTLTTVLLPQAVTAMLPSLVSQLVVILKDTALGYMISYPELLNRIGTLSSVQGNIIAAFLVAAVIFIIINWLLTQLAGLLEKRMRRRSAGRPEVVFGNLAAPPGADIELYTDTHQFESDDEFDRRTKPLI